MLGVYNHMTIGLALTGLVALGANMLAVSAVPTQYQLGSHIYLTGFGAALYLSPLRWLVMFAPLAFVLVLFVQDQHHGGFDGENLFFVLRR